MLYCVFEWRTAYSLGHLSYVFVSQAHPQVIVFMKKNLFSTGVSHAAGLIAENDEDKYN